MLNGADSTFAPPIEWVGERLARLDPSGLRRAVVMTGSERVAHAIRRHVCVDLNAPELLAGVSLLRPTDFACELLLGAAQAPLGGWEALRRLRLFSLFLSGALDRQLRYFDATQLRSSLGYADAFAATIRDLECSGIDASLAMQIAAQLEPSDAQAAGRLHDVAYVWQRVDNQDRQRWSAAEILTRAAAAVGARPELATAGGSLFAVLTNSPSAVLLRFLTALPDCAIVLQEARPWRTGVQRWRSELPLALPAERTSDSNSTSGELGLLQRYLFEVPEVLTDPERPRSNGAEGSVAIVQYASMEEEVEAAASWVAGQVTGGVPLEQIALMVPELGPYTALLTDRLQRLPSRDRPVPVHVAGGLSLAGTSAGLRLLAVCDAVAESLDAPSMIRLLPMLRRPGQSSDTPSLRLSPSRAAEIVYGAGILGGTARDSFGLNEWLPRLRGKRDQMLDQVAAAEPLLKTSSADRLARRAAQMEVATARQWLREVEPILPAIESLQQLTDTVVQGATLDLLWRELRTFCETHLLLPPQPPGMMAILAQRLASITSDPVARELRGQAALHYLRTVLAAESIGGERFGAAAIFIGTPAQASGLPFTAVWLLGLAEGAVPRSPHDDPIVPDDLRRLIEETAQPLRPDVILPRLADRVLEDVHDAFRAIQGTTRTLVLSVPRQWTDRSERELSGIVLEVATALGRRTSSDDEGDVPTAARLRAAYFEPDGDRARASSLACAPTPRARLDVVTRGARNAANRLSVPRSWEQERALSIGRLRELTSAASAPQLSSVDGTLADAWAACAPPGLGRRPISASALGVLLACPHRFLLERVLHLRDRHQTPPSDSIGAIRYGELFHAVAERFFLRHGSEVCGRVRSADELVEQARALADQAFETFCQTYPLRGRDSIDRERERLGRQIEALVRDEWQRPKREFVASELSFGERADLCLPAGDEGLTIWGAIDRVDRLDSGLSVRDIKTGRIHDFVEEPVNAGRDLQLGVYVLATEQNPASGAQARVVEAAYVHPSAALEPDRRFTEAQLDGLRQHTRDWLRIAAALLRSGQFVRTPSADDCRYCPFLPACGDQAANTSATKLRQLPPAHQLEPFVRLKMSREGET